jgi:hypothetical protein
VGKETGEGRRQGTTGRLPFSRLPPRRPSVTSRRSTVTAWPSSDCRRGRWRVTLQRSPPPPLRFRWNGECRGGGIPLSRHRWFYHTTPLTGTALELLRFVSWRVVVVERSRPGTRPHRPTVPPETKGWGRGISVPSTAVGLPLSHRRSRLHTVPSSPPVPTYRPLPRPIVQSNGFGPWSSGSRIPEFPPRTEDRSPSAGSTRRGSPPGNHSDDRGTVRHRTDV